jgi:predicted TIM-barrel fold metal-dependent hydrolase
MVTDRHYTPGPASVDELRAHMARHAVANAVIVQPSFYGTDNRCMLDALLSLNGAGRGVAVLADDVSSGELHRLRAAGVRGIRINLESASVRDPSAIGSSLAIWARKIADFGWHIQVYAAPELLSAAADQLAQLPVTTVLDHFAMIPSRADRSDPSLRAVLALLGRGSTYVKLSAPYRISADPANDAERIARLAAWLHDANPERILWGTDWPHTNREPGVRAHEVSRYRDVPNAVLIQALQPWEDDAHSAAHLDKESAAVVFLMVETCRLILGALLDLAKQIRNGIEVP